MLMRPSSTKNIDHCDIIFWRSILLLSLRAETMKNSRRIEVVLMVAIFAQALAIIFFYELAKSKKAIDAGIGIDFVSNSTAAKISTENISNSSIIAGKLQEARHTSPSPGGLILSASFSYMPDPRLIHRKKPLPFILPTFENIYYFHTTVNYQKLHAIIFHDDYSFNETFVKRHTTEYIKFIRIESPTFDHGEPVISPNDFRFVVFNKWLKDNAEHSDNGQVIVNDNAYDWILISDLDMMFNRNPFPKLNDYANRFNLTFFGSYDGGKWEDERMHLQRKLFRNCYGRDMILKWRKEVEWPTPNGNCGLWAGRFEEVSCVLDCMARQYDGPPVQGKGSKTICDMATHDYCVHYGGCFPGSEAGVYDENKIGVLWGEKTQGMEGQGNDLFGPPYGRYRQCDRKSWTVLHNRCDWIGPLCFRKDADGNLETYHQQTRGRTCRLNPYTLLPRPDSDFNETIRQDDRSTK